MNKSWSSQPTKPEEPKSFFDTVKLAMAKNGLTKSNSTPEAEINGIFHKFLLLYLSFRN